MITNPAFKMMFFTLKCYDTATSEPPPMSDLVFHKHLQRKGADSSRWESTTEGIFFLFLFCKYNIRTICLLSKLGLPEATAASLTKQSQAI